MGGSEKEAGGEGGFAGMRLEQHPAGANAQFSIWGIYGTTEFVPLRTATSIGMEGRG